jgi:hypothetical protein
MSSFNSTSEYHCAVSEARQTPKCMPPQERPNLQRPHHSVSKQCLCGNGNMSWCQHVACAVDHVSLAEWRAECSMWWIRQACRVSCVRTCSSHMPMVSTAGESLGTRLLCGEECALVHESCTSDYMLHCVNGTPMGTADLRHWCQPCATMILHAACCNHDATLDSIPLALVSTMHQCPPSTGYMC